MMLSAKGRSAPESFAGRVELDARLETSLYSSLYRGEDPSHGECAVHVLSSDAPAEVRDAFVRNAQRWKAAASKYEDRALLFPLSVDVDRRLFTTRLCDAGTLEHLPALGWSLERRLSLLCRIADAVAVYHDLNTSHGALRPDRIRLDSNLDAFLEGGFGFDPEARRDNMSSDSSSTAGLYDDPQRIAGRDGGIPSDIYSLGRILHFLLIGDHPIDGVEERPVLRSLARCPAGLTRIVRKCTLAERQARYHSISELVADLSRYGKYEEVGERLSGAIELNHTGISQSVLPPRMETQRPTEPRTSRFQELRAAFEPPPDDEWASYRWRIAVGGGIALVAAAALTFLLPRSEGATLASQISVAAGCAALTVLLPAFGRPQVTRIAVAVTIAAAAFHFPVPQWFARAGSLLALQSGSVVTRANAVRARSEMGDRDFRGLELRSADLSGLNLSNARLDGSDLESANLHGADLTGARLLGACLRGADLDAALLMDIEHDEATRLTEAMCTVRTVLPRGYICTGGHVAPLPSEEEAP